MSSSYLELDERLPSGFTPRELIDSVPREQSAPAYLWPADVDPHLYLSGGLRESPGQTSVTLRLSVHSGERVELRKNGCARSAQLIVPATLEIVPAEYAARQRLDGYLTGSPDRARFVRDEPAPARPCELTSVHFVADAPSQGATCAGDGGAYLRWPTPCGGFEQTTPELASRRALLPSPRDELAVWQAVDVLQVHWSATESSALALRVESAGETCQLDGEQVGWSLPLRVRAELLDAGLRFDMETLLGVWLDEAGTRRDDVLLCQAADADNALLRAHTQGQWSQAELCLRLGTDDEGRVQGELSFEGVVPEADGGLPMESLAAWHVMESAP